MNGLDIKKVEFVDLYLVDQKVLQPSTRLNVQTAIEEQLHASLEVKVFCRDGVVHTDHITFQDGKINSAQVRPEVMDAFKEHYC